MKKIVPALLFIITFMLFAVENPKELLMLDFGRQTSGTEKFASDVRTHRNVKCAYFEKGYPLILLSLPPLDHVDGMRLSMTVRAASTSKPEAKLTFSLQEYASAQNKNFKTQKSKIYNLDDELKDYTWEVKFSDFSAGNGLHRILLYRYQNKGNVYIERITIKLLPDENKLKLKNSVVVVAPDADSKIRFAAKELAYYIGEITGQSVDIVLPDADVKEKVKIHVGLNKTIKKIPDTKECCYDGYWHAAQPDGSFLIIGRSDVGTVFGTYGFLQDVCGVRFYLPGRDGTYVPKNPDLTVPLKDSLNNPFFKERSAFRPVAFDWLWHQHNRMISHYDYGHKLYYSITEKYAKTHPEYFAYSKGQGKRILPGENGRKIWEQQPCMTNPEVIALAVNFVLDYFKNNPDADCIPLGINDSTVFCECKNCEKINEGSGTTSRGMKSYAKLAAYFYNAVAGQVSKVYPDKYLGIMGYNNIMDTPDGISYHPNIIYALVTIPFPLYFDPSTADYAWILRNRNGCSNMILSGWRYGFGYLVPNFPMTLEEQFLDFAAAMKAFGIGYEQGTFWTLNGIKDYLFLRKCWNPSLRSSDLLREFAMNMYGNGAEEILAFYELSRKTWEEQRIQYPHGSHLRNSPSQFKLYNSNICARLLAHLEKAKQLGGKEIQGAIWLDRQIDYFRWLNDYHEMSAMWSRKEPSAFPELTDWCIQFEKMRRRVTAKYRSVQEPNTGDYMKQWFPAESNAFLLLKKCILEKNMNEWKRFMKHVGDIPEIQWVDNYSDRIFSTENLVKNARFHVSGAEYNENLQMKGSIKDWSVSDWGSKAFAGRRIEVSEGIIMLEGIKGSMFYPPMPVAMQKIRVEPDAKYLFACEYLCSEEENLSGSPWLSDYRSPPYTASFKPYIRFYKTEKGVEQFLFVIGMSGLGKISYRMPMFMKVESFPESVPVKPAFQNHIPPVMPEPSVYDLSNRKGAIQIEYQFEGLYDLKVKMLVQGSGFIKVAATYTAPLIETGNVPDITSYQNIFESRISKGENLHEFIYRVPVKYANRAHFRIMRNNELRIMKLEVTPVPAL